MPTPSLYQKSLAQVYKLYSHDVGRALVHMGTMEWFFSSLAQVTMIAANKKIDKKEKKFLIPQEIVDGAINVGISLETTEKILAKFRNDNQTCSNWVRGITEKYV